MRLLRGAVVTYDELTCITAGEMRAAGIDVPANIPDAGWVPRAAVTFSTETRLEGDAVHCTTTITFEVPFTWIDCVVRIEANP